MPDKWEQYAEPASASGADKWEQYAEIPSGDDKGKTPQMGVFGAARAIAPALMKSATETGKGFAKQIGSDIYGLATGPLAGPLGFGLGYLGERSGVTKKVNELTAPSNTAQKVGGYLATGAEFLIPGPAEAAEGPKFERLGKSLAESAEKQYTQVLNPTTRGNKVRATKIVPEMMDRGIKALTLKGLGRKTSEGLATATEKLEDAYAGLPPNAAIPADGVLSSLMASAKDMFTAGGKSMSPQSDTAISLAKELGSRLMDQAVTDPRTGNKVIPVEVARKTRQIYDEIARAAGRYEGKALADHSSGLVHGMAADSIREMLNQVATGNVNIGDVNKEYNFWRNADTVVQETLLRKQGQARPLGQKLAQGAGAILGGVHGGVKGAALGYEAMRAVEAATTSAAWRTTSAVMKNRLANALASGNQPATTAIANAIAKGVVIHEARDH